MTENSHNIESTQGNTGDPSTTMNIIKVSARSRTAAVAGAIAGVIRESQHAEVQAIGAGAVNQAVKAIVIAKGYLAEENVHIVCVPSFVDVDIEDQERTAIRFVIEPHT
jgi:stage V sporulation protein S